MNMVKDLTAFQRVASYLFKAIKLDGDPAEARSEGYTFTLDNRLEIHLIGAQEGFLNMLCIIGPLPQKPEQSTLMTLLYANRFSFDYPQVSLGLDSKTQDILVWARQRLDELDEDSTNKLFARFAEMATMVHAWLGAGAGASEKAKRSSAESVKRLIANPAGKSDPGAGMGTMPSAPPLTRHKPERHS